MKSPKKSQADVIVTILLIFIGIVAIVFLSTFAINFAKNRIESSNTNRLCLEILGNLKFALDRTYYNKTTSQLFFGLERSSKEIKLTGFLLAYKDDLNGKVLEFSQEKFAEPTIEPELRYWDVKTQTWKEGLRIPNASEIIYYRARLYDSYALPDLNTITVTALTEKSKLCQNKLEEIQINRVN